VTRTGLTADHIASVIADDASGAHEINDIVSRLRVDLEEATRVLDELARHRNADVRFWVSWAAREVLGERGVPLVLRLARDRDPDVRDGAVQELVKVDPEAARSLIPALRRQLASTDIFEPVFAMWTLVELGDREAAPLVRQIAAERASEYPFHQKTAAVVALLLEGREDEVLDRIRSHDHELMQWLVMAAVVIGTPEARAALEECARTAPDEECRQMCAGHLSQLSRVS
jgi:hypothetical protein